MILAFVALRWRRAWGMIDGPECARVGPKQSMAGRFERLA